MHAPNYQMFKYSHTFFLLWFELETWMLLLWKFIQVAKNLRCCLGVWEKILNTLRQIFLYRWSSWYLWLLADHWAELFFLAALGIQNCCINVIKMHSFGRYLIHRSSQKTDITVCLIVFNISKNITVVPYVEILRYKINRLSSSDAKVSLVWWCYRG